MTGAAEADERAYIDTYFPDLSPPSLRLALLSRGVRYEPAGPLRYLELGFGRGLSLNVHAAANAGVFWGNDYVPEHVAYAQSLASASGADAHFTADSFVALLTNDGLPQVDIAVAHGIWTWVRDEDRAAMVQLLTKKLAPGGLFCVSYNTTSGWAGAMFLRQIMKQHAAANAGAPARLRTTQAVEFAQALSASGAGYFKANPMVATQLAAMTGQNLTYLSHEFFGEDWKLMSLADVSQALAPAGLTFAASTMLLSHNDELALPPQTRALLETVSDPVLRETVRESAVNQQFRQDIFVKGPVVTMSEAERREALRAQLFMLTTPASSISAKASGPLGEIDLAAHGCGAVIEALARDGYAPKTGVELETLVKTQGPAVLQAVLLLAGAGHVRAAQSAEAAAAATAACTRLNAALRAEGALVTLASPVLGAGIILGPLSRAFLLAMGDGAVSAQEVSEHAWRRLRTRSDHVETAASVLQKAQVFAASHLPVFRALGVA